MLQVSSKLIALMRASYLPRWNTLRHG